jgi:hypothetical protein
LTPLSPFQSWVPRGWCQLADTAVTLLAPEAKDRTAFGESSMPRLLLYQSFTQASAEEMPYGTLLAQKRTAILQLSLVLRAQLFPFSILVGVR